MPVARESRASNPTAAPAAIRRRDNALPSSATSRTIFTRRISGSGATPPQLRSAGRQPMPGTSTSNYSNMHRWGSQVEGVVFSPGTSGVAAQVPKPVNDTTQNFGVNGEYKGTSTWGQPFTFKLGYSGSDLRGRRRVPIRCRIRFAAPQPGLRASGECARNGSPSSPFALMTLWPNNSAHGLNSTVGADLPLKSRYMGTVSYTWMRQNDSFIPHLRPVISMAASTGLVAAPGCQHRA